MLPRFSATVAGLTATTAAAIRPAAGPGQPPHRPVEHQHGARCPRAPAAATMAQVWKPNARTASAWIHSAPGSLSTVTVPAGSNAPKKKLCQLIDMLRTAAA